MKLLHLIASLNPAGGGPVEGLRRLTPVVTESGHPTEVATLDPPDAPWLNDFPVPVHALGPFHGKYRYSSQLLPWLEEHRRRYDVLVVNGIWQYHSFCTWRALHRGSTPYALFTHGMLDPWFKKQYPLKHLKKVVYWNVAEYRVLRDAATVLFTCEEERLLARQSFWPYRCNESVVNYGTAEPQGDPQAQRAVFFDRYPDLAGKRLLLFMGRIHPKKGCDLLLKAFATVLGKEPDWRLVIAGPDQCGWQAQLQQLAARNGIGDRITWAGMISGDVKWGAYHAAEVFVLPSHQENFGIVIAEALACGVPVLLSTKVNIWREVEGDNAGIAAEDDLEGTCHLLRSWKELPEIEQQRMRANARSCFWSRFHIRQTADSFLRSLMEHT